MNKVTPIPGFAPPAFVESARAEFEAFRKAHRDLKYIDVVLADIIGILRACQAGLGIAMLPDYIVEEDGGLVQLLGDSETIALDAYFVYPEELKSVARVQAFRDFLVSKAQRWNY